MILFITMEKNEQLIEFLLDQMTNAINFKQADKDFLIYSWLVEKTY